MTQDEKRREAQTCIQRGNQLMSEARNKFAQAAELLGSIGPIAYTPPKPPTPPDVTAPTPKAQMVESSRDFREALEAEGERTIKVRPGLKVELDRSVRITHGALRLIMSEYTVQATAPIQMVQLAAPNCVIAGLNANHEQGDRTDTTSGDVLSLQTGCTGARIRHCTLTGGTDEIVDGWGEGINDIELTDSIIGFGRDPHNMGMIVGGGVNKGWRFERNLMAYCENRMPYISVDELLCANNVIFKTGARGIQAFPNRGSQTQRYHNNFVVHQDGQHGSWGSANLGRGDGSELTLIASGNLNNTTRTSLEQPEHAFWSQEKQIDRVSLPARPDQLLELPSDEPMLPSGPALWRLIRSNVGAPGRDQRIKALVAEIDTLVL